MIFSPGSISTVAIPSARQAASSAANPIVAAGRHCGLPNQRVDHLFLPPPSA